MKSFLRNISIAVLTFLIGTAFWWGAPWRQRHTSWTEPLVVTLTPKTLRTPELGEFPYVVTVKNVSDKPVRGYSLGFSCACRGWDSNDQFYPDNIDFTNPIPDKQILLPGESQNLPLALDDGVSPRVWVDLVHFESGENWGPNRGHKEGYVR